MTLEQKSQNRTWEEDTKKGAGEAQDTKKGPGEAGPSRAQSGHFRAQEEILGGHFHFIFSYSPQTSS